MRYFNPTLRMAKIQNSHKNECWCGCRAITLSLVGLQNHIASLKDFLAVFAKLSIFLPYDPAITLLDIYSKHKLKTNCTQMFTPALFRIAKTWKQPQCPTIGDWLIKIYSVQIME
jgi:hypothetical protein